MKEIQQLFLRVFLMGGGYFCRLMESFAIRVGDFLQVFEAGFFFIVVGGLASQASVWDYGDEDDGKSI